MRERPQVVIASQAGITIRSLKDISNAIGSCMGADGLILAEDDLCQEFFVLKSGLAGELMQKCTNYRLRLALVVPNPPGYGERFAELAYEHRTHNLIRFVSSLQEAEAWLAS